MHRDEPRGGAGEYRFRDREQAGRLLGAALAERTLVDPIVLALPRGGVPVGLEVARALGAPLDVWVVRKLGVPWQPELGVGAVAEGGFIEVSRRGLKAVGMTEADLSPVIERERAEVARRVQAFRGARPRPALAGRSVVVVDDGVATGNTARVALRSIRAESPAVLLLAVPVAAPESLSELDREADAVVSLLTPRKLDAIGLWYDDFAQVPSAEVSRQLELRRLELGPSPAEPVREGQHVTR